MDVIRPILALVHVGSALLYVAGYVSTKMLTRLAVKAPDLPARQRLLELSGRFDFWFQIPFGTLVGISGVALTWASGYAFGQLWIVLSILVYAAIVFIGAGIWRRRSALVRDAMASGDDARVVSILAAPRAVALGWIELALIVAVVVLMVLRPT